MCVMRMTNHEGNDEPWLAVGAGGNPGVGSGACVAAGIDTDAFELHWFARPDLSWPCAVDRHGGPDLVRAGCIRGVGGLYVGRARDDVWLESLGFFTRRIARIRRQCLFAGLANHYLVESLSGAGYDGLGYQSLSSVWEYQRPGGL